MERFYWLVEDKVAGCSRPGGSDRRFSEDEGLGTHLAWLRSRGIGALLTLTETPLSDEVLSRHDIEALHLPVPDMTAPLPDQLLRALDFIDWQRAAGRAVAVHCLMGQGRTATVLAAYLIRSGMSSEEAIDELRRLCPGAIPSLEQEQALHAFAGRRDWIV